jgi:dihydrolipoamide dehydrogenase
MTVPTAYGGTVYDVAIIGGGPGGYAAALYAHNFGLSVALVEKDEVGGTCLLRGCIPAKTWLQTADVYSIVARSAEYGVVASEPAMDWPAALARKQQVVTGLVNGLSGLLKSRGVDVINGYGRLIQGGVEVASADGGTRQIEARNVIIATGSVPRGIPGYEIDGTRIVTSDQALDWPSQPRRVAIIGGGVIGCEFASLLSELGTKVHLFEALDSLLPGTEPEAVKVLARELKKHKVKIHTSTMVGPAQVGDEGVVVPFGDDSVEVEVVLVAVGRAPVTAGIGLEEAGVTLDHGFVVVEPESMLTSAPGVYAVGDIVAGTPQLAHAGFAEGIAAITHIATEGVAPVDYRAIPLVAYTHPEVASVGLTEAAGREAGIDVEVSSHGMRGVGRAIIQGQTGGVVKIISERDGAIIGATIAGPGAGEMIHELMYAVAWEALPAEAAALIHAHPTISEAVGETLLAASGRPLH